MRDRSLSIAELLKISTQYLKEKGIDSPRLCAELLLAHALGQSRMQLYLEYDKPLKAEEIEAYRHLIRRRLRREPLQYILGKWGFYSVELEVGPGVLIPRPETEILVEAVLRIAKAREFENRDCIHAVDMGTGCGCIPVSICMEDARFSFVAIDISAKALSYARQNISKYGLEKRIELREGNLFATISEGESFDFIISNPPYVSQGEWLQLEPEVKDYEPKEALIGGPSGLEYLLEIGKRAREYLRKPGYLLMELSPSQSQEMKDVLVSMGYGHIRVIKDLNGRDRVITAIWE